MCKCTEDPRLARAEEDVRWWQENTALNASLAYQTGNAEGEEEPVVSLEGFDLFVVETAGEGGARLLSERVDGELPSTWRFATPEGQCAVFWLPDFFASWGSRLVETEDGWLKIGWADKHLLLPPLINPNFYER